MHAQQGHSSAGKKLHAHKRDINTLTSYFVWKLVTVTEHTKQGKGVTPKKPHHGEHVETWYEQRIKTVRRKIVEKFKKRKGSMTSYLLNL